MTPDCELLRQYAKDGNEAAFAEVVRRHLNLVYASAARLLNDDATLAEDVTQAVFTSLARKAATLSQHQSLAGWLYTSVRFAASSTVRAEQRRRTREHEAHAMSDHSPNHEAIWAQLRPLIDEALLQLKKTEREAVLLRFFEDRSHREVGDALGLTESAAQMRVGRAMDKMRAYFARHGVTTTVALLATTLGAQAAGTPAPAVLTANIAAKSLAGAAAAGPSAGAWLQNIIRAKKSALLAGTVAVAATGVFAAKYFSLPQPPLVTTKAIVAATMPIQPKTASTPAPTMNPPKILNTAVLSAALLSASATTVTAATSQTVLASEQSTASASQQSSANPLSSDTSSRTNQDTATSTVNAQSSSDTEEDVPPAPPGMGIAIWDLERKSAPYLAQGQELISSIQAPHLVDMSGALNGKTITAIDRWGGITFGKCMALCSDGTVALWGPGYAPSRIGQGDDGFLNFAPAIVDTSILKDNKIAMIGVREGGNYILTMDGALYWISDTNPISPPPGGFVGVQKNLVPSLEKMDLASPVTKICGGWNYFLATRRNGTVITGGYDEAGCLGNGPNIDSTMAGRHITLASVYTGGVLQGKKIVNLAADGLQSLALCSDGTLAHWGYRVVPGMYELGLQADNITFSVSTFKDGANRNGANIKILYIPYSDIPVRVMDETSVLKGKPITALAHVEDHILVLCADGTVAAWGGEVAPLTADTQTNAFEPGGKQYYNHALDLPATSYPILVSGTGALAGKTVTAITDGGLMLCSDNTLVEWNGDSAPVSVNLGAIKGRTILAIAPGMALFK